MDYNNEECLVKMFTNIKIRGITVSIIEEIKKLKEEKDVVILAHYYVDGAIQDISDYVGDSYYLSKVAVDVKQQTILFCGVEFMGESAKILNPNKTVLLPEPFADCPMAHMANIMEIKRVKQEYEDVAVVCYINSTAELKQYSDVCVTSANAMKIVKALPNKNIYFIPDENLGRYIATKVPEKNFIFNNGYCHVHKGISEEDILKAKELHPGAKVLVHPECRLPICDLGDYVGSTSGIIDYAKNDDCQEFIIATEMGVFHKLQKDNPNKKFYLVNDKQVCPNMKKITLEKILTTLQTFDNQVEMEESERLQALSPLEKMLELAK